MFILNESVPAPVPHTMASLFRILLQATGNGERECIGA